MKKKKRETKNYKLHDNSIERKICRSRRTKYDYCIIGVCALKKRKYLLLANAKRTLYGHKTERENCLR